MFSYLRPHHKRTISNPSSPAAPGQSFESSPDHGHPQRQQDSRFPDQASRPPTRPPPTLPPIARVSTTDSGENESQSNGFDARTSKDSGSHTRPDGVPQANNWQKLQYGSDKRPGSAGNHTAASSGTFQSPRQVNSAISNNTPWKTSGNFSRTEPQPKPALTGRKANGSRLPSPPPSTNFAEPPPRSGKTRLNLLNPMSLLARRRTSQAITQLSAESLVSRRSNFSDPRIHGTVVHDFSAPRAPRKNASYNDSQDKNGSNSSKQTLNVEQNTDENLSSWSGGNHTPVFTENFEEEQYPAAGPHVRKASDLTDLPPPQPPYAKGIQKSSEPVLKPRDDDGGKSTDSRRIIAQQPVTEMLPPPPKVEAQITEPRRISIDISSTPPRKGRSRNVSEVSMTNIPKHMKSTSSRFSFDMIGAAKQERLLEDRHRQKALEKKAEDEESDERVEDEFEDFDYDGMDDDDLEERIPGVNADLEEEYPDYQQDEDHSLGGFTFQQASLKSPMSPTSQDMINTPRDCNGEVIGFALSRNSPYMTPGMSLENAKSSASSMTSAVERPVGISGDKGLGLQGVGLQQSIHPALRTAPQSNVQEQFARSTAFDDDDLYFDDGMIGGLEDVEDHVEFDESVFDNLETDQYGRPLQKFSAPLSALYEPPNLVADVPSPENIAEQPIEEQNLDAQDMPEHSLQSRGLAPQSSVLGKSSAAAASHGLTQDSLAAYQTALAAAAFAAVADGKFDRENSPLDATPSEEEHQPGLVTDSSQASHYETFSPSYEIEDDFDYDDALEDDAIIAAANAEALANDCDGFYGQEFGFYSAPAGEAEYVNGGYFGPRGVEAIGRSQSGRALLREPNLTPITERSEYSNRNSFMSFQMQGVGSLPSPGLAQLAGMLRSPNDFEGDMNLEALMKARRGAWGGSQASLHSSPGSPKSAIDDSSPVAQHAPWSPNGLLPSPLPNGPGIQRRKNSVFSIGSDGGLRSEVSSEPASPTLTLAALRVAESPNGDDKDAAARSKKYKHTTSAESISYSKEEDPVVGERWILERRRAVESGEIELLGREVVSGGRI